MVTGTDADLRRQNMKFVHEKLKENGYSEEVIAGLLRWDKIDLLRDISNKQMESGNPDPDLLKFSRNMRMTTSMQKQKYQNEINKRLGIMINKVGKAVYEDIPSDDEMDLVEDFDKLLKKENEELQKYRKLLNKKAKDPKLEDESVSHFSEGDSDRSPIGSVRDLEEDIAFD